MAIPIIDIFAGPGGLGEGFSALRDDADARVFKIALSIEKDPLAHKTLTLRSFFRQFITEEVPDDYYRLLEGKIKLEELYKKWPKQAAVAQEEAWNANLGSRKTSTPYEVVDSKIKSALNGEADWILIGGPPCQAYSVIGRVRKKRKTLNEKKDERVGLYKHYLRILALHNPSVFVMENVRGLLTAKTKESPVFTKILKDLSDPVSAYKIDFGSDGKDLKCPGYKIYSLVKKSKRNPNGQPDLSHKDYLIKCEDYGIPQTRHRVILLGIRNDIEYAPRELTRQAKVSVCQVISGLPRIRSKISRAKDDGQKWKAAIMDISKGNMLHGIDVAVQNSIKKHLSLISLPHHGIGAEYVSNDQTKIEYENSWFADARLKGVCNHTARSHMRSDLHRYIFVSCFAKTKGRSPTLGDFPKSLLPAHKNVHDDEGEITRKFADRFKVQLKNKPSKTITSHISQDGHYYIHYDPTLCRSFTVREAARIQTFPDNYFFCGPRTSQFIQVGNAVPPLLAHQIALIVHEVFSSICEKSEKSRHLSKN